MLIKKFIARSLPEALSKAKSDLGKDAVILKTRFKNKGSGVDGRFVEVTASIGESENITDTDITATKIKIPSAANRFKSTPSEQAAMDNAESFPIEDTGRIPDTGGRTPSEILSEIRNEIRAMREDIARNRAEFLLGQPSGIQLDVGRNLIGKHLPEYVVADLLRQLPDPDESGPDKFWNTVLRRLAELLGEPEPIKIVETGTTVIMLVGPTGGGKSSSAARLAFQFTLEDRADVRLVTTDNFRADSREQLQSLADVIGCPFTAVSSPDELAAHLKTIDSGLVLIDTSGCASRADADELAALIGAANPHEIHLVIPAAAPAGDIIEFIETNPDIRIDRLFITKLDQTAFRGGVIGAALKSNLKFSYQSSSRDLPGDITLFDPMTFVSALKPSAKTLHHNQSETKEAAS